MTARITNFDDWQEGPAEHIARGPATPKPTITTIIGPARCRVPGCDDVVARSSAILETPAAHGFCLGHLVKIPPAFKERWANATSQDALERIWKQIEDDFVFEAAR